MSRGCLLSRGFRFIVEGFNGTLGGSGFGFEISGFALDDSVTILLEVTPLVLGVFGDSLESVPPEGGLGGTAVGLLKC